MENMPFGHNLGYGIYNGTCGILSSSILLTYYHKHQSEILPPDIVPDYDPINPPITIQPFDSKQNLLHKHFLENYAFEYSEDLKGNKGTTTSMNVKMINTFIGNELKNSNIHAVNCHGLSDIKASIDNNEPIALGAYMHLDPRGVAMLDPGWAGHVVVVYGYKEQTISSATITYLKVHLGWHGNPHRIRDNHSFQQGQHPSFLLCRTFLQCFNPRRLFQLYGPCRTTLARRSGTFPAERDQLHR